MSARAWSAALGRREAGYGSTPSPHTFGHPSIHSRTHSVIRFIDPFTPRLKPSPQLDTCFQASHDQWLTVYTTSIPQFKAFSRERIERM